MPGESAEYFLRFGKLARASSGGFPGRCGTLRASSFFRRAFCLSRKRFVRCRRTRFFFQRLQPRARTRRRTLPLGTRLLPAFIILFRFAPRLLRNRAAFWRGKFHTGPTRFGKPDGNRLLGGTRTMFSFADVFHFLADKFTGLCGRRFPLRFISTRSFDRLLFWHNDSFQKNGRTARWTRNLKSPARQNLVRKNRLRGKSRSRSAKNQPRGVQSKPKQ